MTIPTVDQLPDGPSPDDPTNFADEADTLVAAVRAAIIQVNTTIAALNAVIGPGIPGGTAPAGTLTGDTIAANVTKSSLVRSCEGRLTLTTGVPITSTDDLAAETLYWTPYKGNKVSLYDGVSAWVEVIFTELSIDVPDATNCYDVFVYNNAGTAALELTAWTNETARATALTLQDGVLVKTGATTRRYLGTFYSTTAGNGQIEDSKAKRNLWNYYNRLPRLMSAIDTTDSWAYTTATWRQARASTANQLEFVIGVSEEVVKATVVASLTNSTAGHGRVGIGLDVTNAISADQINGSTSVASGNDAMVSAEYAGYPGIGRHYLAWLEYSPAVGTTTWSGDAGGTYLQSGIKGVVFA